MALVVQKYGGSSLKTAARIKRVARNVVHNIKSGHKLVIVVSAQGGTTDRLIKLACSITEHPERRELDMLLSTGEQVTIALLAMAINALGHRAISFTGQQAMITTTDSHTKAKIKNIDTEPLIRTLQEHDVVIVAGFQGMTDGREITTLGRGGSDITAVALAAVLRADLCEIYSDVKGVYTADPRIVPTARALPRLCYDEVLEMASMGAKVLHPRAVEFAKKYHVIITLKSTFDPLKVGTVISEENAAMEEMLISGVTCDQKEAKLTIRGIPDLPGVAYQIFGQLADAEIQVDMIIQSAADDGRNRISFTVGETDLHQATTILEGIAAKLGAGDITTDSNIAKISVIGVGMRSHAGVAAKMFKAMYDHGINIDMISTSEIKISCVIDRGRGADAVVALHDVFGLGVVK